MRQTQIFSGSSHPALVDGICDRLGQKPGQVELGKFSNGETSVQIRTSIRNQDVFIVQSGSNKINDHVMELLIMISACKGGSAKSVTAVMPYFPYSRQSKKKAHRGAITARMIANLLHIAGVNHVITIDLHASQMQGFFKCPVDNLVSEPMLARWIKHNVRDWREGVVVSKNPGGTKRVTSLADAMKLSFGLITTDSRIPHYAADYSINGSMVFERFGRENGSLESKSDEENAQNAEEQDSNAYASQITPEKSPDSPRPSMPRRRTTSTPYNRRRVYTASGETPSSLLAKSALPGNSPDASPSLDKLVRISTAPITASPDLSGSDQFTDERARDVTKGRFVQGHIVDEEHPSPAFSALSGSTHNARHRPPSEDETQHDPMASSFLSTVSSLRHGENTLSGGDALGGSMDAAASSEEEEEDLRNPTIETTITLVGNVRDRPVFIVDDMIDKAGSWIAAAETVVKRGGATAVYCMATHGLFGADCLAEMQACDCIDKIVVTNSFPIEEATKVGVEKLVILDVSPLLSEAIRRNHYGESISQLYMHYAD